MGKYRYFVSFLETNNKLRLNLNFGYNIIHTSEKILNGEDIEKLQELIEVNIGKNIVILSLSYLGEEE